MKIKKRLRSLKYEENVTYYSTFIFCENISNRLIDSILEKGDAKITYHYHNYNTFNNAINKARKIVIDDDIYYCHILVTENKITKGLFVYNITKSEVKYNSFYDLEKIRVFQ